MHMHTMVYIYIYIYTHTHTYIYIYILYYIICVRVCVYVQIIYRRDESDESRKELVELVKDFKEKTSAEIKKTTGPVIKRFQTEAIILYYFY